MPYEAFKCVISSAPSRNHAVAVCRMLLNLGILCWVHCFLDLREASQHLYNLIAKIIELLECFQYDSVVSEGCHLSIMPLWLYLSLPYKVKSPLFNKIYSRTQLEDQPHDQPCHLKSRTCQYVEYTMYTQIYSCVWSSHHNLAGEWIAHHRSLPSMLGGRTNLPPRGLSGVSTIPLFAFRHHLLAYVGHSFRY